MQYSIYDPLHKTVREENRFVEKWISFYRDRIGPLDRNQISNGICLDAGCGGTVKGVQLISHFGPRYTIAMDINQQHGQWYGGVDSASFVCGDLLAIPFEDETFNFALCNGAAHHTSNPRQAVRELYRVLKPGGTLYISVYCFKRSLFHAYVMASRLVAKLVPFSITNRLFGSNFNLSVLLDHAYVPNEFVYRRQEFADMLTRAC